MNSPEAVKGAKNGVWRRFWREWIRPFSIVLVCVVCVRSAVADWNHVPTRSMQPTILIGDRIFVNKVAYDLKIPLTRLRIARWDRPKRGDVIVFLSPVDNKRLVKRVIGVPGDNLEMKANRLTINGQDAVYAPLDPNVVIDIEAAQRDQYRFLSESIGAADHPIMTSIDRQSHHTFPYPTIPEGKYFVMGDNRDESSDSRLFGLVDEGSILGRATAVAISVDPERFFLPRWGRFFSELP